MTILIECPLGNDRWEIKCAPQHLTDILVQVYDLSQKETKSATFTFKIGELMLEEIEQDGVIFGAWRGGKERREVLLRWALLLERYAEIMRVSINSLAEKEFAP